MKRCAAACLGLIVLAAMVGSGCLFSPDPKPEPPPPIVDPPGFASPDAVIAGFLTAYTSMRIDDYSRLLSPQYAFILRPEDVPPGDSGRLTFDQELATAENMFSGLPLERPGYAVPAISSISIAVLNRQGTWLDVGPDDHDFPNTLRGLYSIQLTFARVGANTIIVNGQQEFYVASRDTVIDGETKQYYLLRGQRDLTIGSKTEVNSWGSVKILYR